MNNYLLFEVGVEEMPSRFVASTLKQIKESTEKMIKEKLNSINLDYSIQKFSSGEELLSDYKDTDIIFLDIKMSKLSGMDTARKIREIDKNVEIIFTTALQEYVFEAYDVRAFR